MKTHYRNVFKSDHLGVADLEDLIEKGRKLIFTIKETRQFILDQNNKNSGIMVAGKRISANIAYFKEDIKPMVINATNGAIIKSFCKTEAFPNGSPLVEDWKNVTIELYIDSNIKMKGETVGGVRIKPVQPRLTKPVLTKEHPRFNDAKQAAIDGKLQAVLDRFEVSNEVLELLQ